MCKEDTSPGTHSQKEDWHEEQESRGECGASLSSLNDCEVHDLIVHGSVETSKAAMGELFIRYYPELLRYALKLTTGDIDVAKDIVAAAFEIVLHKIYDFNCDPVFPKIKNWIISIVKLKFYETLHESTPSHARYTEPLNDDIDLVRVDVSNQPLGLSDLSDPAKTDEEIEAKIQRKKTDFISLVLRTVDFSVSERKVIIYLYLNNMERARVAMKMSLSEGNIRVIHTRAIAKIRKSKDLWCTQAEGP